MTDTPAAAGSAFRRRILSPIDRNAELLFGLIMVLTFTGAMSAATAGREDVREMLFGAIGCNLAWGIVDAVMYLMNTLTERGRGLATFRAVRSAAAPAEAHAIIRDALPPVVSTVLGADQVERIRRGLAELPEAPRYARPGREEWLGAAAVFFWVFLSTFPVVVPFIFMTDARLALRISNGIAIALLFFVGFSLGRHAGGRAWLTGLAMVLLGFVLVGITIALGG